jgi:hypothetical protein
MAIMLVRVRQIVTSSGNTMSHVCVTKYHYGVACRILWGRQKKSAACWILQGGEP